MWRHISGVEQPAKKIKLDNNKKLERKRTLIRSKEKENFKQAGRKTATGQFTTVKQTDMFSLHTICFFRQDDGDAGDDDVSSNDNTDILSSL